MAPRGPPADERERMTRYEKMNPWPQTRSLGRGRVLCIGFGLRLWPVRKSLEFVPGRGTPSEGAGGWNDAWRLARDNRRFFVGFPISVEGTYDFDDIAADRTIFPTKDFGAAFQSPSSQLSAFPSSHCARDCTRIFVAGRFRNQSCRHRHIDAVRDAAGIRPQKPFRSTGPRWRTAVAVRYSMPRVSNRLSVLRSVGGFRRRAISCLSL